MPLVGVILEAAKPQLVDVAKMLLNLGLDVKKSLGKEIKEISRVSAETMYDRYQALVKAGFSKGEAFQILLTQIQPGILANVSKFIPSSIPPISKTPAKKE